LSFGFRVPGFGFTSTSLSKRLQWFNYSVTQFFN